MPRKRACDSCRAKKVHCDGGDRCEWCTHRNLLCTYGPTAQQKARKARPGGLEDEIEQRIFRLEKLVGAEALRRTSTFPRIGNRSQNTRFEQRAVDDGLVGDDNGFLQPPSQRMFHRSLYFAGCDLGDISSRIGIPVFSEDGLAWIEERTGVSTLFESTNQIMFEDSRYLRRIEDKPKTGVDLPHRNIAQSCFNVFSTSSLGRFFPFIDPSLFAETLHRAYQIDDSNDTSVSCVARICLFAFMAVVSLLEPGRTPIEFAVAETYAREAQATLLYALVEPTLEGLEAALMLCMYQEIMGNIQGASVVHAVAVRCVYGLRGHVKIQIPSQSHLQSHLRHLFWLCYFFDKHISLRTGQPSAINDFECDLLLEGYRGLAAAEYSTEPLYPSDLQLTVIKSKVSTMLYSAAALRKSDAELLRDIRDLDDQLEQWRLSMPVFAQPHLSVLNVDVAGATEILRHDLGMLIIFIHLEYLYLVSAIHRACGRCTAWSHGVGGPEALSSSLSLSVYASRSTLVYLKAAYEHAHHASFWLISFYPLWAILTIFCSILHDPKNESAQSDMETLATMPRLLKEMHVSSLNTNEACQLHRMEAFISELVRLAYCAIVKASGTE